MKKAEFLRIAAMLREEFRIIPLLYGSLGLECRLNESLNADDIDILIPRNILKDEWNRLKGMMNRLGYRLYDEHEHAFEMADMNVAFADLENLQKFAGVAIERIPVLEENGVEFLLLELEDYLKVYMASSEDGYRKNVKHKQDQQKIELIKRRIERRA